MGGSTIKDSRGPLLVGLDMGTTNIKAVAYEPDGRAVSSATAPTVARLPQPNWAFYNPVQLWALAAKVLREATANLSDSCRIVSIAVASMGEAGIPLDDRGEATYDAIAWFDQRTAEQALWLAREIGEDALFATTGLALQPFFGLCKIMWIKKHQPEAFARTVRWLNIADYIAFKLCGIAATDWSLASRTLIFDIRTRAWDANVMKTVGVSPSLLAPLMASGTKIGAVTREAAAATGLPHGCVVGTGGHDHVCGAFAAGVVERGHLLDSMGTAEALFLTTDAPLSDPELGRQGYTQGAHVAGRGFYLLGGVYASGASVDWAHRLVGKDVARAQLIKEAEAVPAGSLGVGFLPHLRLANPPHSDAQSRAAFIGLTSDVARGAMFRSVLEGIAYEARASAEPLLAFAGLKAARKITVIGGSTKNTLLLRIKAAVMNAPFEVVELEEAVALGAALLGGIAAGVYRDADDAVGRIRSLPSVIEPDPKLAEFYDRYFHEVFNEIYAALRPLNQRINAMDQDEPRAIDPGSCSNA